MEDAFFVGSCDGATVASIKNITPHTFRMIAS
jgi:hypothetical protein